MYQILFYTTQQGDSPIDEFLDGLDKKSRAKVAAYLSLLEERGPSLKRPYADSVRRKVRELHVPYRSNQYRMLHFFYLRDQIIIVHVFAKKTQQLRERDMTLAEHRMKDWITRHATKDKP